MRYRSRLIAVLHLSVVLAAVVILPIGSAEVAGACSAEFRPTRVAGADRVTTATAISQRRFPAVHSATAAVLARSDDFADALAGAPLAVHRNGPLLLTGSAALDPRVRDELLRAVPPQSTVYVLGGNASLSPGVEEELRLLGYDVRRVSGRDRYETAVAVAEADGGPRKVFLATGRNFADGVVAGAIAANTYGTVLFTNDRELPPATAAYLSSAETVYAFGDQAADAYPQAIPVAGETRYDTSVRAARLFYGTSDRPAQMGVATGTNFPDALAGSTLVTEEGGGPLLLTPPERLPDETDQYIGERLVSARIVYIYGDHGVVSQQVQDRIENLAYTACGF